jgi:hypothetical protein
MTTQVFVVGTGRSGTATLSALLSVAPGCRVVHEQEPALLPEVRDHLTGQRSSTEIADLLRRTRSVQAIGGERLSGEANQRLSFVLPALAEAFPKARLVWVIRDGRTAVASMHHRKWYHPREAAERPSAVRAWATDRLAGDAVGYLPATAWARLDPFGRCCWYWAYTNRLIERETTRTDLPVLALRLEELEARLPALAVFLGLTGGLPVRAPHTNRATGGRPLSWRAWSPQQRETFQSLCDDVMDRHYPGWRADMQWTAREEMRGLLVRSTRATSVALASRTRALRTRLGLVRGVPAGRAAGAP